MTPRVLLVDHFDSFTWNVVHLLRRCGADVNTVRSDALVPEHLDGATHVVFSPGPRGPSAYPASLDAFRRAAGRMPVLGVCLGHQLIVHAAGGEVSRSPFPVHGRATPVAHRGRGLLAGIPSPFDAARYHSLIACGGAIPSDYVVDAWTDDDARLVMAVSHRSLPIFGVQFHPESFLTDHGGRIASAFLETAC